jgi:hypothetical protein
VFKGPYISSYEEEESLGDGLRLAFICSRTRRKDDTENISIL